MGTETNRFGLSRNIPASVKRAVRRAAGFGCVCCGIGIASYEHIDPEFHNATSHDPEHMAYLCEGCHSKVTRGMWSKDKVKVAQLNPWCLQHGNPHDAFDVTEQTPTIWLGPNRIVDIQTVLEYEGEPLLQILPGSEPGEPFNISARFFDSDSQVLFRIEENEWIGESTAWDIESVGTRIIVRREAHKIALQIRAIPPNGIVVERADMSYQGVQLFVDHTQLRVTGPNGGGTIIVMGRTIRGKGPGAILASAMKDGRVRVCGPLEFEDKATHIPVP